MARWALVAGPKRTDRSGTAVEVVEALAAMGVRAAGVVQAAFTDAGGRRRYDLLRLGTGERTTFAAAISDSREPGFEAFCHVTVRMDAFEVARRWLAEDAAHADALVIGDVSKLEVGGGGHDPAIAAAVAAERPPVVLLCVRADQLFDVVERYRLPDEVVAAVELPLDDEARSAAVAEAAEAIAAACREPYRLP